MKRMLLTLTFLQTLTAYAQQAAFKPLRYDEDYSGLKADTSPGFYKRVKYLPLSRSGDTWLSFGGDARFQYFHFNNEQWGDAAKEQDGFILSRYLLHADAHIGKRFRAFVELQSSLASGRGQEPTPIDKNQLDLHQAFFDVVLPLKGERRLTFRLGRQEMLYGSQRLVSVRDALNNRQAFDAGKVIYETKRLKADAFYSGYVTAKRGVFDDLPSADIRFWGAYAAFSQIPFLHNIDAYYFGLMKEYAEFDDWSGKERRYSFGTRIWKRSATWQYDVEGVYQWGSLSSNVGTSISAWMLSSNIAYTFDNAALKPQLGLKAELSSGNKDYYDDRMQTFNPLFPGGAYFGLATMIGPSNLADIHPYLNLKLTKQLSWQTDYYVFRRMSSHDGIYGPDLKLIYSGRNATATDIGQQLATSLEYTPNPFLYFRAELAWFNAGSYLEEVSPGKNILMAGATMQLKF